MEKLTKMSTVGTVGTVVTVRMVVTVVTVGTFDLSIYRARARMRPPAALFILVFTVSEHLGAS